MRPVVKIHLAGLYYTVAVLVNPYSQEGKVGAPPALFAAASSLIVVSGRLALFDWLGCSNRVYQSICTIPRYFSNG